MLERHISGKMEVATDVVANVQTSSCKAVPFGSFAGGCFVPGSGITSVAFYGGMEEVGPFYEIKDADDAAVAYAAVTAGDGYTLPDQCFAWRFLKLVTNAAGTITLNLKS